MAGTTSLQRREERANTASHGVGALLALAAMPVLAGQGASAGPAHAAGLWIFAATMLLVYAVSSAYHAAPVGRNKVWLKRADHAAIFVFMAGTFTPFALGHALGAPLLAAVWAVALVGVLLKFCGYLRNKTLSTALYLAFGWFVLAAAQPLLQSLGREGTLWLLAGGIAYTVGTVFFVLDQRLRFSHFVWHLFVLVGSGCHFVAVLKHSAAMA